MIPILLAAAILAAPPGPRQDAQDRSVPVQVTSVAGESVYLDKGGDALIEPGDRVLLNSTEHGVLTGRVDSVTKSGARCTLDAGRVAIPVGTKGEILIPASRGRPVPGPGPKAPPEHPPWTAPPESWDKDRPLLVPAGSRRPEERPTDIFGYAFSHVATSTSRTPDVNTYRLQRIGANVAVTNPVEWGGTLWFRGLYENRSASVAVGADDSQSMARLHQLSYVWGGLRDEPVRLEIGRFLQHDFPELGTIDGAEGSMRAGAIRFGASAGVMPNRDHEAILGPTTQAAVFARAFAGARDELSAGLALQKTWQEGEPDRDLLVGALEYAPSQNFFVRGAAWVDFYTSSEVVRSSGAELTEAHVDATYRFDTDHGVGFFFAMEKQPDQLRDELDPLLAQQYLENAVTRAGFYTWQGLSPAVFLDGRASQWIDQDGETGQAWDARLALRNALFSNGEAWISTFVTDGIFSSGTGIRIGIAHSGAVPFSASYEIAENEIASSGESLRQQAVLLNVFAPLSRATTVASSLDRRFGDGQDSWGYTVSLNVRF